MIKSRKGNGFFCPKQYEDGTYCQEKAAGVATPAPAPSPTPTQGATVTGGVGASRGDVVMAAALDFASRLYQGGGASAVPDAIKTAQMVYAAMVVFKP